MPKPIRGAENAEIECRIGAKSGAASAEITCRFQPKSGAGLLRFLQAAFRDETLACGAAIPDRKPSE